MEALKESISRSLLSNLGSREAAGTEASMPRTTGRSMAVVAVFETQAETAAAAKPTPAMRAEGLLLRLGTLKSRIATRRSKPWTLMALATQNEPKKSMITGSP
jgi:hypothetical protein